MKKIKLFITIFAISILYNGCKSGSEVEVKEEHEELAPNTVEMNSEQIKTADIQLGNVEQKSIGTSLKANGTITVTPQGLATICAPFGGFIKSTSLVQGSPVTKGQTLALIENVAFVEIQQSYFETKAKYDYAEKEYNRQKDLYAGNVNSAKSFQQAESEYKTLKAQLNGYIQKLSLLNIDVSKLKEDNITSVLPLISPITGYVKTVNVNIGKSINATDVLFEIINNQSLTLELVLFEKDMLKVSVGQKLTFSSPGASDVKYTATIYQIGKALDDDKTIKVYAYIDKPDNKLVVGMFVNAEIEVANNIGLTVPSESIVRFDEKFYIFAFKEKKMEGNKEVILYDVVEVKKGSENNGFTEISFVNDFDFKSRQVVVKGAYTILSKFKNSGEMSC